MGWARCTDQEQRRGCLSVRAVRVFFFFHSLLNDLPDRAESLAKNGDCDPPATRRPAHSLTPSFWPGARAVAVSAVRVDRCVYLLSARAFAVSLRRALRRVLRQHRDDR